MTNVKFYFRIDRSDRRALPPLQPPPLRARRVEALREGVRDAAQGPRGRPSLQGQCLYLHFKGVEGIGISMTDMYSLKLAQLSLSANLCAFLLVILHAPVPSSLKRGHKHCLKRCSSASPTSGTARWTSCARSATRSSPTSTRTSSWRSPCATRSSTRAGARRL